MGLFCTGFLQQKKIIARFKRSNFGTKFLQTVRKRGVATPRKTRPEDSPTFKVNY
jgi:hypothetical protein